MQELIAVYRELARRSDFALHLGLTEAGIGSKGIVASSAALGVLLQEGIGDTIRISLTPEPGQSRTNEVIVAQELLQTMGLRAFTPMVTACPGCGRTTSSSSRNWRKTVQEHVRAKMPEWKISHPGAENLTLAVMGCVVNGPGESRHANIGISLPGTGEAPSAPVFVDGEKTVTLRGENIAHEFVELIDGYVERRYGAASQAEPVARTIAKEARFGAAFLRRHGWRLLLLFIGLLLPLWGFAELADEIAREASRSSSTSRSCMFAHELATRGLRPRLPPVLGAGLPNGAWCRSTSRWCWCWRAAGGMRERDCSPGSRWAVRRCSTWPRSRCSRATRPSLWESIAPEDNFQFPQRPCDGFDDAGLGVRAAGLAHALALAGR